MATLGYATGLVGVRQGWLDYDKHECDWEQDVGPRNYALKNNRNPMDQIQRLWPGRSMKHRSTQFAGHCFSCTWDVSIFCNVCRLIRLNLHFVYGNDEERWAVYAKR